MAATGMEREGAQRYESQEFLNANSAKVRKTRRNARTLAKFAHSQDSRSKAVDESSHYRAGVQAGYKIAHFTLYFTQEPGAI
jgi:hypothetical protein